MLHHMTLSNYVSSLWKVVVRLMIALNSNASSKCLKQVKDAKVIFNLAEVLFFQKLFPFSNGRLK